MKLIKFILVLSLLVLASLVLQALPGVFETVRQTGLSNMGGRILAFASVQGAPFLIFIEVVLLHALLAMPAKQLGTRFGEPIAKLRYIEAPLPIVAFLLWLQIGWLYGVMALGAVLGLAIAANLGLSFAALRVLDNEAARLSKNAAVWQQAKGGTDFALAKKRTYYMRVGVAMFSFVAACQTVLDLRRDSFFFIALDTAAIVCAVVGVGVAAIGYASSRALNARLIGAKSVVATRATTKIKISDITVAHYVSDPKAQLYGASTALITKLKEEGIKVAVFVREAEAIEPIRKAGPEVISFIPNIMDMDKYTSKDLKTVLYVNDEVKNGHFTRFIQYKHVLVVTGAVLKDAKLPQSYELYDRIVAPTVEIARTWIENSGAELRDKIVVLGKAARAINQQNGRISGKPTVGIFVQPSTFGDDSFGLIEQILGLLDALKSMEDVHVTITYSSSEAESGSLYRLKRAIAAWKEDEELAHRLNEEIGNLALAANTCEIFCTHSLIFYDALIEAQKPVVWLSLEPAPTGYYGLGDPATTMRVIRTNDPLAEMRRELTVGETPLYPTFDAFFQSLDAPDAAQGDHNG